MYEDNIRHEEFEYAETPFRFVKIVGHIEDEEAFMNHWHEELEMIYCIKGHERHFINGKEEVGTPGRLIVTNSGFVHNIIPDPDLSEDESVVGFVIIIQPKFLEDNFPQYNELYFTNENLKTSLEIKQIIGKLYDCCDQEGDSYGHLYVKGLVLELLYHMTKQGTAKRTDVDDINILKDIERIKGVIKYVETNYANKISQAEIAKKFYFSPEYFSRYFKKCLGITFTEYLTSFRLEKAKEEIVNTTKSVSRIALENGFSDDRRLIIAFKKKYGTTPLQYRKAKEN